MVIRHDQAELLYSRLDGVPARQARREVDVASQTEIGRVENLVCAGVVEDGLGVDAGLVGEGAEAGDGVVERRVDLDRLGDQVLNLGKSQWGTNPGAGIRLTSLSMCSLYLLLTYSGLDTTMRARRPPRGVMPLRSPTTNLSKLRLC